MWSCRTRRQGTGIESGFTRYLLEETEKIHSKARGGAGGIRHDLRQHTQLTSAHTENGRREAGGREIGWIV